MPLRYTLMLFLFGLLISGCQNAREVEAESLMHHSWQLEQIDQQAINSQRPILLAIGERLAIKGHTGCNQFFGQGTLNQARLQINGLGTTKQLCPPEHRWIENAILSTLRESSKLQLTQDQLVIKGSKHTLVYQFAK